MVPDINMVREKNKRLDLPKTNTDAIFKAIEHFCALVEVSLSSQLVSGYPASCKLEFWAVRSYMEIDLRSPMKDEDYFEILDAVFSRINMIYTLEGYIVLITKKIGTKSNYAAYYESYYTCEVRC